MTLLRDVAAEDLPIFFAQQRDPDAIAMAAFPARDRAAFDAHWDRILRDDTVTSRTIVVDDQVAGNVVCFGPPGERSVGYWVGRAHWGHGIATQALAEFLREVRERPLYAHVAEHNIASIRVLEKCGFSRAGAPIPGSDGIVDVVLELRT